MKKKPETKPRIVPLVNPIINSDIIRTITSGARNLNIVTIVYRSENGEVTLRDTEPYEIRDNKYWAYCLEKQGIRQFHLGNILDAKITTDKYRPRFPVNIF